MNIYQILSMIGVPTLCGGIISYFMTKFFKRQERKNAKFKEWEELDKQKKINDAIKEQIENSINQLNTTINNNLTEVKESIQTQSTQLDDYIKSNNENTTMIKKGLQAVLRDRLNSLFESYFKKGYATQIDRREVENIYNNYHNLGQNGVMDDNYRKFLDLPMIKPKTTSKRILNEKKETKRV